MKIYTKTGDRGETGLIGGIRVSKDHLIIEVCGTLDETNSLIGLARSYSIPPDMDAVLEQIQADLFVAGSQVAQSASETAKRAVTLSPNRIPELEESIDQLVSELPPMTAFILPGGAPAGAVLHLARTVCRRAERNLVTLIASKTTKRSLEFELVYLNRLSDFLFTAARKVNHVKERGETKWLPGTQ